VAERTTRALEQIQHDDLGTGVVDADSIIDDAARAGNASTPVLKAFFARSTNLDAKGQAASDLVLLGDKDPIYWYFLVEQARAAVESDPPLPSMFSTDGGRQGQAAVSPEIAAWAQAHKLQPEAAMDEILVLGWRIIRMARTGDPRGEPVLMEALHSHCIFFQGIAAMGFAAAQQASAVPLILDECKRSASEGDASFIAEALPLFHREEADRGYLQYFSADDLADAKKHIGTNPWRTPTTQ
jgi:hypothetical protein